MNTDLNPDLTEVLDLCLRQMQQGKTIEDCAARYPHYPELVQLLRTAAAVQSAAALTMPVSQADQLEQRLLGQLRDRQPIPPKARTRPLLRLLQTVPVRLLLLLKRFAELLSQSLGPQQTVFPRSRVHLFING